MPKVSVVVPIHDMENGAFFLWRLANSLTSQTFKDWELIITKDGKMAENTNSAIRRSHGEIVKILYLDDYFAHPDALKHIVERFNEGATWLITGASTNPHPYWNDEIVTGKNTLGSPSALAFKKGMGIDSEGGIAYGSLWFDERMSWLLDCDFYHRMYKFYGKPSILDEVGIIIGEGPHQMTHKLTDEEKLLEYQLINDKFK